MPKPKSDLSEFAKRAPYVGVKCWGQKLSPEQQVKIEDARKEGFSYRTIAEVINDDWKIPVTESALPNHLRRTCQCFKHA